MCNASKLGEFDLNCRKDTAGLSYHLRSALAMKDSLMGYKQLLVNKTDFTK